MLADLRRPPVRAGLGDVPSWFPDALKSADQLDAERLAALHQAALDVIAARGGGPVTPTTPAADTAAGSTTFQAATKEAAAGVAAQYKSDMPSALALQLSDLGLNISRGVLIGSVVVVGIIALALSRGRGGSRGW